MKRACGDGIEAGAVRGVASEDGKFIFGTPAARREAVRRAAYHELLISVLRSEGGKRVFITPHAAPESEQVPRNSWLVHGRGCTQGAASYADGPLNGYAAFKSGRDAGTSKSMLPYAGKHEAARRRNRAGRHPNDVGASQRY